jgi:hypothetical protein
MPLKRKFLNGIKIFVELIGLIILVLILIQHIFMEKLCELGDISSIDIENSNKIGFTINYITVAYLILCITKSAYFFYI